MHATSGDGTFTIETEVGAGAVAVTETLAHFDQSLERLRNAALMLRAPHASDASK